MLTEMQRKIAKLFGRIARNPASMENDDEYDVFRLDPVVNAGLPLKECVIKIMEHRNRWR